MVRRSSRHCVEGAANHHESEKSSRCGSTEIDAWPDCATPPHRGLYARALSYAPRGVAPVDDDSAEPELEDPREAHVDAGELASSNFAGHGLRGVGGVVK